MQAAVQRPARKLFGAALAMTALAATSMSQAHANGGVYLEQNGLIAIHIESAPTVGAWHLSTSTPGHTGEGYFRWNGPNEFTNPGNGMFGYDLEVTNAGTYTLYLRNRHEHPDPTEENDVWMRMDGGTWEKIFSNGPGSVGGWTWESRVDHHSSQPQMTYHLTAGLHRIELSGRSHGFKMDRLHLALPNQPNATNPNAPESTCRLGVAYGNAIPNSTGNVGRLEAFGSNSSQENDVVLRASNLPAGALSYFLVSSDQGFVGTPAGSSGNLLLGGNIGRYAGTLLTVDGSGRTSLVIDLERIPQPSGTVSTNPGQTWNFQLWHRDMQGGSPTSNLTHGLSIRFD